MEFRFSAGPITPVVVRFGEGGVSGAPFALGFGEGEGDGEKWGVGRLIVEDGLERKVNALLS